MAGMIQSLKIFVREQQYFLSTSYFDNIEHGILGDVHWIWITLIE